MRKLYQHIVFGVPELGYERPIRKAWVTRETHYTGRFIDGWPEVEELWWFIVPGRHWEFRCNLDDYGWCERIIRWNARTGNWKTGFAAV